MKIAVAYENGNVFQHFGKTENFIVYEVENGEILNSQVINTNGEGHGALARFLAAEEVSVLICGGLGEGAKTALQDAGITLCSGASGNTDEAVRAYLAGELTDAGVNCDHHHDEHHDDEESSGCGESHGGCGGSHGGCGGCGGGCGGGSPRIYLQGPNAGKNVSVHYTGTLDDGSKFDSSLDRNQPLEFICGAGMMIPGFDRAVCDMEVGQTIDIHLEPEDAYGPVNPAAIMTVETAQLQGAEDLEVGQRVYLTNSMGQPFPVTVTEKTDTTVTFDANHELAGKALNFNIELLSAE